MLRVGIVGVGLMGSVHAAAWASLPVKIAGFHGLNVERGKQLTEQFGGTLYSTFDSLITDVDVVDICTPTYLHHDMVIAAAQARKQIICEKPLALTVADGQGMIAACESAGVHLLIGQVVRFFPEYALAKATVERGEIGSVAVVRLTRASAHPRWSEDNWLMNVSKSGGMMFDLMVHDFDYARWVAGDVEAVYAKSVRTRTPDAPGDYAHAILTHTNGALSHIEGGWAYPPPMFRTALEIAGDRGLIEHPAGSSVPVGVHLTDAGSGGINTVPSSPLLEDPYAAEIRHFYEILTGAHTDLRVTAHDALQAVRIALAAVRSAQTGKRVKLSEIG
jgi:myo-inositol 2-dehydrogenase / D-chiro-inositol 1-dehydrogenase